MSGLSVIEEIGSAVYVLEGQVRMRGETFDRSSWEIRVTQSTWDEILRSVADVMHTLIVDDASRRLFGVPIAVSVDVPEGAFKISWSQQYALSRAS